MEALVSKIIFYFSKILTKELIVFIISIMPLLELRGGLIAASILKIKYLTALPICLIGNILPIPFILLFIRKILELMEKWNPTKPLALWLRNIADKKKSSIEKYGFWGLVLFVGIPLPGTGAWTGALIASLLHMDIKKSATAILLGIVVASIIMSIISYKIIYNIL